MFFNHEHIMLIMSTQILTVLIFIKLYIIFFLSFFNFFQQRIHVFARVCVTQMLVHQVYRNRMVNASVRQEVTSIQTLTARFKTKAFKKFFNSYAAGWSLWRPYAMKAIWMKTVSLKQKPFLSFLSSTSFINLLLKSKLFPKVNFQFFSYMTNMI